VPPRETAQVFVPLTPTPFPTPLPSPTPKPTQEGGVTAAATTWDDGIGDIFNTKCGGCHNSAAKLGGLDLTSYGSAMTGGQDGAVIISGDAENSKLVQIQQAGGHPGELSPEELQQVIDWINNGAAQN
jgi:mono/diheme cytochrome c family protein